MGKSIFLIFFELSLIFNSPGSYPYVLGYIQPDLLISRLQSRDVDGLMDRHLVSVTNRRRVKFSEIGPTQVDEDLQEFLSDVYTSHRKGKVYKLSPNAGQLFEVFFDDIEEEIVSAKAAGNLELIGMLNKSAVSMKWFCIEAKFEVLTALLLISDYVATVVVFLHEQILPNTFFFFLESFSNQTMIT